MASWQVSQGGPGWLPIPTFGTALEAKCHWHNFTAGSLARCLIGKHFAAPQYTDEDGLRRLITVIWAGGPWPFGDDLMDPFIELCAHCLAGARGGVRGVIERELTNAMLTDGNQFLRSLGPGGP